MLNRTFPSDQMEELFTSTSEFEEDTGERFGDFMVDFPAFGQSTNDLVKSAVHVFDGLVGGSQRSRRGNTGAFVGVQPVWRDDECWCRCG